MKEKTNYPNLKIGIIRQFKKTIKDYFFHIKLAQPCEIASIDTDNKLQRLNIIGGLYNNIHLEESDFALL